MFTGTCLCITGNLPDVQSCEDGAPRSATPDALPTTTACTWPERIHAFTIECVFSPWRCGA